MARITIEELYLRNRKYSGILNDTTADLLRNGCPADYTEQTWLEMLIVKHTLIAAEKMKKEGDFVSGMTDTESLSSHFIGNYVFSKKEENEKPQ